jgi:hypothetical protein
MFGLAGESCFHSGDSKWVARIYLLLLELGA